MGAPLTVPRRLITVDQFHRMGEAGIFHENEHIELIEGELIQMAPIGGHHLQLVNVLTRLLDRQVADEGVVSPQNPISLPPDNEPQPDIAILRPANLRRRVVPTAQDVLLVVEVSVTTLEYDRDVKIPIYARHPIPEAWLVDAQSESVSIYLDPSPKGYRRLLTPQKSETISPILLPNVRIRLSELWQ
jgi:Uma2 family endonuclease